MKRLIGLVAIFGLVPLIGCAEGPMHRLGHLNPWVVQQWDKENSVAPSLQAKRENIRQLAKAARGKDEAASTQAIATLAEILTKEDLPLARIEAALALGESRGPEATAALIAAVEDSETEVRIAACDALGKLARTEAVPTLERVINSDTESDVQLAAARALGNIKDPTAVRALSVALDSRSPALQYRAVESLKQISGEDFKGDVDQWRSYAKGEVVLSPDSPSLAEKIGGLFR